MIFLDEIGKIHILNKINYIDSLIKEKDIIEDEGEKAILVGSDTRESLEELRELTKACDIPVLESVYQSRSKIDAAFYIGRGKVLEIAQLRQKLRANVIIFDDELSGSQVRNLEAASLFQSVLEKYLNKKTYDKDLYGYQQILDVNDEIIDEIDYHLSPNSNLDVKTLSCEVKKIGGILIFAHPHKYKNLEISDEFINYFDGIEINKKDPNHIYNKLKKNFNNFYKLFHKITLSMISIRKKYNDIIWVSASVNGSRLFIQIKEKIISVQRFRCIKEREKILLSLERNGRCSEISSKTINNFDLTRDLIKDI